MLPMLPDRAADRCRGTADCEGCCCRVELSPGKAHARWSSVLVELSPGGTHHHRHRHARDECCGCPPCTSPQLSKGASRPSCCAGWLSLTPCTSPQLSTAVFVPFLVLLVVSAPLHFASVKQGGSEPRREGLASWYHPPKNGASFVNGDIGKVTLGGPHCLGSACANSFCPFPPLLACRWHSGGLSVRGLSTPSLGGFKTWHP